MVSKENSPRSALKFIDEALEFQLSGLIEKGVLRMDGVDEGGQNIITRAISDVEPEEELNELAAKCLDSYPNMHVPLRKLRGTRKEKSIVALERRTRSKKFI